VTPKRTDANQAEIVAALRQAGASVQTLHEVGHGCPDVVVGHHGKNWLFEIKTEAGKLNARESLWHHGWNGQASVIRSVEDALAIIGVL